MPTGLGELNIGHGSSKVVDHRDLGKHGRPGGIGAAEELVELVELTVVATRGKRRLYVEVKGRTTSPGLDTDTMYGQLLRRMPADEVGTADFAVVLPTSAIKFAERVPLRVRQLLRIHVYGVDEEGVVTFAGLGVDPILPV